MTRTKAWAAKKEASEHKIQCALMDYLQIAGRKDLHWFAIPNGEKRHIAVASRLKAEGVRRGSPDLVFILPDGKTGFLEMKNASGSLSPDQKAFRDKAKELGHLWGMARSVDEALPILTEWGVLKSAYQRTEAFYAAAAIHPSIAAGAAQEDAGCVENVVAP